MENKIENLKILNFKSIEHIDFSCKKVNIFIGKPNVGKSNILEAISLLNNANSGESSKFAANIRYEQVKDLFHFKKTNLPIIIKTNLGSCSLTFVYHANKYIYRITPSNCSDIEEIYKDDNSLSIEDAKNNFYNSMCWKPYDNYQNASEINSYFSTMQETGIYSEPISSNNNPVKMFLFKKFINENLGTNRFYQYLLPPNGNNLLAVLENYPELMVFCQEKFQEYDLNLIIDKDFNQNKIEILRIEKPYFYKIPYSSIADTLQRMIFHQAAIISNQNSIILFEEPEAHSFPPYIKELAESIAEDETNQYFIATHSPFILNTILENTSLEDVNLFKVSYENHKTSLYKYSDEELLDLLNFGEDIFFNI